MSWRALSRSYDVRNLCRGVANSIAGCLQTVADSKFWKT